MKRNYSLLMVCLFVVSLLCFSSCRNTDVPEETTDTAETTDTIETTAPQETAWKPDPLEPWNYTPACPYEKGKVEGYDIEITLDESVFSKAPEQLTITVKNKTMKPFRLCLLEYYEKLYPEYEVGYTNRYFGSTYLWVRLPINTGSEIAFFELQFNDPLRCEYTMTHSFSKDDFEFTPGQYRLVMFAGDGPHYAYFEITG